MSLSEWVGVIGGICAILVIITGALMWYVRAIVRDEVSKATRTIQPGYRNGGESLADIAYAVRRISQQIGLDDV